MRKKRSILLGIGIAVPVALAALAPVAPLVADTVSRWTASQAVEQIMKEDLNLKINATDPELSTSTMPYQSRYADDLEKIQDASAAYSEKAKAWQTELAAYTLLYNYRAAQLGLELAEEQTQQALDQLETVRKQMQLGLASEMDEKRAQLSYNQALASLEDARQQHAQLQMQLNQKLGNEFREELVISLPDQVTLLPRSEYNASRVFEEIKDDHASLEPARTMVAVYEDLVERVDRATVVGGREMENQIETLEEQRAALEQQYNSLPDDDPAKQEIYEKMLAVIAQLDALEKQLDDAEDDRDLAVKELEEYYKELLEESKLNLEIQLDALELMTHQYEERFTRMENKLKTLRENAELADELYQSALRTYEQGLSTLDQADSARLNVLNTRMQLFNLEAQYAALKEEFRMFKEGYMPAGASGLR